MAGRRQSKVVLQDEGERQADHEDDDKMARRRTLSISHSGRFKEQKRRGALSERVFAAPTAEPPEEKRADAVGTEQHPAALSEQTSASKMTVVFETKL